MHFLYFRINARKSEGRLSKGWMDAGWPESFIEGEFKYWNIRLNGSSNEWIFYDELLHCKLGREIIR